MKKLLLLLLLTSCITNKHELVVVPHYQLNHAVDYDMGPEVFPLENNSSMAVGIIAEYRVICPTHLYEEDQQGKIDITILGMVSVRGLELCSEQHLDGTVVYYNSKYGPNYGLIIFNEYDDYARFKTMNPVLHGESGTPVKCVEHNKVIGIITNVAAPEEEYIVGGESRQGSKIAYLRYLTVDKLQRIEKCEYVPKGIK